MEETIIDASPKNRVNENALFQRVEVERERIYRLLYETLDKYHIKGEVTKSSPYEYSTWILIRLWHYDEAGGTQYRGEATITINPIAARRHSLVLQLKAKSGGRKKTINRIIDFDAEAAYELIGFIANSGQKLRKSRFKRHGLFFFNKNKAIKRPGHWYMKFLGMLPVIGIFLFVVHPLVGIVSFLAAVIYLVISGRKERVHFAGIPPQNPRNLVRMDSWQSVIIELGNFSKQVKDQVTHELVDGKHEDALINEEEVSYLSTQGKSERHQIVINFRRAIAFVEIHQYGSDLYVDWEAFLNLGVWTETAAGIGYDSKSKCRVKYMEVERALEGVNEYDISDANFLIEWVHACLTRVVRQLKKELSIDQEFDFTIQRSDRRAVLHEGEQKAKSSGRRFSRKN